jgi:hypothetical protein
VYTTGIGNISIYQLNGTPFEYIIIRSTTKENRKFNTASKHFDKGNIYLGAPVCIIIPALERIDTIAPFVASENKWNKVIPTIIYDA